MVNLGPTILSGCRRRGPRRTMSRPQAGARDAGEFVAHGEERGVSGVWLFVFPDAIFSKRDGQRIAAGEPGGRYGVRPGGLEYRRDIGNVLTRDRVPEGEPGRTRHQVAVLGLRWPFYRGLYEDLVSSLRT